tara:strand:- start:175 stop:372 length:198 start_codon:yes stop_codon:yes gene_type:complete
MDTQGMTAPGEGIVSELQEYPPYIPTKLTAFTDMERKELKELIHEVLDEREHKNEDDSWLYRGTY